MSVVWFVAGGIVGGVIVWLIWRERETHLRARLEVEQQASSEKLALLQSTTATVQETLDGLALRALDANSERFLGLTEQKVGPLREALQNLQETIRQLEQARSQATGSLSAELDLLSRETRSLSRALRTPDTVGSWGQVQLKRVVEMAGMQEHCDFDEEQTYTTEDGHRKRPDVTVHLPGGVHIAIDAKVPRSAFLDAELADDEAEREKHLQRHAQLVREHLRALGKREYWKELGVSPECVVMFVPHEPFISAACQKDPELIEDGFAQDRVMIATPLTLIALLLGFAAGWRQVRAAENAAEVAEHGKVLYERVGKLADHFRDLRKHLNGTVVAYNETIGSIEGRVLPEARKFPELLSTKPMPEVTEVLVPIEDVARDVHAPEFVAISGAVAED